MKEIAAEVPAAPWRELDRPLILYGAGNLGKMAGKYLRFIGIPFLYVVDANSKMYENDIEWSGIPVLSPSEVSSADRKNSLLAVCISTIPFTPLSQSLQAQGWECIVPFYDVTEAFQGRHPLKNGWFSGALTDKDMWGIHEALSGWADDISRAHHLQFLAWRCLRQEWVFADAPVTPADRYFIPQVVGRFTGSESFLDIGAHHGEVCVSFADIVHGRFKSIVAVEPDRQNLTELSKVFQNHFPDSVRGRISVLDVVISDGRCSAHFLEGHGYTSQLSSLGEKGVVTVSIDDLQLSPTFLKVHVEGWELFALRGGLNTLRRCRPIVAITAYHNRQGIWELPVWCMNSLPNYRFFMRMHGWCGTGLVIYALPDR